MNMSHVALISTTIAVAACSTSPKKDDRYSNLSASRTPPEAQMQGFAETTSGPGESIENLTPDGLQSQRLVYFDFDEDNLTAAGREKVVEHARYLVANPDVTLRLEGHADERGSREYNIALGERRARNVKRELHLRGVRPAQITMVSYGEERPAVLGAQREASFSKNRRVEFNYQSGSLAGAPLSYENPVPAAETMTASRPRVN